MQVIDQISAYISSQPASKREDLTTLHNAILEINHGLELWFLDGKNEEGKVVSNPNIGYGSTEIPYADGSSRRFYRVGMSANTSGISIYIMGLKDKNYLKENFDNRIGKASITGYCIKFKSIKDIHFEILMEAIAYGLNRD